MGYGKIFTLQLKFLCFGGTGVYTQGFALAKQVLYCLSHTFSPFCSGYFGEGGFTFCPGQSGPRSSYFSLPAVAGMTGACHHDQSLVEMESHKLFAGSGLEPESS
jgi:hypothetical protein